MSNSHWKYFLCSELRKIQLTYQPKEVEIIFFRDKLFVRLNFVNFEICSVRSKLIKIWLLQLRAIILSIPFCGTLCSANIWSCIYRLFFMLPFWIRYLIPFVNHFLMHSKKLNRFWSAELLKSHCTNSVCISVTLNSYCQVYSQFSPHFKLFCESLLYAFLNW